MTLAGNAGSGHLPGMDALPLLLDWLRPRLEGRPFLLGLAGAQGSGKSTLAWRLAAALSGAGHPARAVSLDDFYLTAARRRALAAGVHPLLATRGVPGTHDLPLLFDRLDQVRAGRATTMPRFDKLADDRLAPQHWTPVPRLDCMILEGWCVGARPQPAALLAAPLNALEAGEDGGGRWRAHVNAQLAGPYQQLWSRLDAQVFLATPSWETVPRWRAEQEATLARTQRRSGMDAAAIARFCAHYERLTRWMLDSMPAHANLTLHLDTERHVIGLDKR